MAQQGKWSFKLEEGQKITKVMFRHGDIVDGIGFEIADTNGKTITNWYSGTGGYVSEITLQSNEHITQISGTYGTFFNRINVTSMKIHTNLKPEGYGPFGKEKHAVNVKPFASPLPLDGSVVGFFGATTVYLDSIGIYTGYKMIDFYGPFGNKTLPMWSYDLDESNGEKLNKIMVKHGYIVDGIGFQITDGNGKNDTKWFGGPGGSTSEIKLGANEYVTQVSGEYGKYYEVVNITSIKIHTNLRPNGYGPYGMSKNAKDIEAFSTPLPLAGAIAGFFGSSGTYLGSIGISDKYNKVEEYGPYGRN